MYQLNEEDALSMFEFIVNNWIGLKEYLRDKIFNDQDIVIQEHKDGKPISKNDCVKIKKDIDSH